MTMNMKQRKIKSEPTVKLCYIYIHLEAGNVLTFNVFVYCNKGKCPIYNNQLHL